MGKFNKSGLPGQSLNKQESQDSHETSQMFHL